MEDNSALARFEGAISELNTNPKIRGKISAETKNLGDMVKKIFGSLQTSIPIYRDFKFSSQFELHKETVVLEDTLLQTGKTKILFDEMTKKKNESDQKKVDLANLRNTQSQKLSNLRERLQDAELKIESLKSSQQGLQTAISRLEAQITQLKSRSLELTTKENPQTSINDDQKSELEALLNMSLESEKSLEIERKKQEEMQLALRNQEVDRTNLNASVNQAREDLEKFKLKQKEYEVRKESLNEQLVSIGIDFKSIGESSTSKKITLESLSSELEKILRSIDRLGAINLAAEAEFNEESKRMEKLDEQFDDLNRALETLTNAIKQIDDACKKLLVNLIIENYKIDILK